MKQFQGSFSCKDFYLSSICRAKRFQTAGTDRPWTSSFRMMLLALARSVTNRRADGGLSVLSYLKFCIVNNILRTMADVCEAFVSFVYSVDHKIRVDSC